MPEEFVDAVTLAGPPRRGGGRRRHAAGGAASPSSCSTRWPSTGESRRPWSASARGDADRPGSGAVSRGPGRAGSRALSDARQRRDQARRGHRHHTPWRHLARWRTLAPSLTEEEGMATVRYVLVKMKPGVSREGVDRMKSVLATSHARVRGESAFFIIPESIRACRDRAGTTPGGGQRGPWRGHRMESLARSTGSSRPCRATRPSPGESGSPARRSARAPMRPRSASWKSADRVPAGQRAARRRRSRRPRLAAEDVTNRYS
mgnify:CR=1 FL=1